jgi:DNA-binding transcriptional ArsR family regulator
MTRPPPDPALKLTSWLLYNQSRRGLSPLQVQIMRFLVVRHPGFCGDVTTGTIIMAIGRRPDNVGYASVSRALRRLENVGLVH